MAWKTKKPILMVHFPISLKKKARSQQKRKRVSKHFCTLSSEFKAPKPDLKATSKADGQKWLGMAPKTRDRPTVYSKDGREALLFSNFLHFIPSNFSLPSWKIERNAALKSNIERRFSEQANSNLPQSATLHKAWSTTRNLEDFFGNDAHWAWSRSACNAFLENASSVD